MNPFSSCKKELALSSGRRLSYYSLPELDKRFSGRIAKLPVCLRIVLESLLRNCDGKVITEEDVSNLASWEATGERAHEVPFIVARVLLQDFTGVPLGVDLGAMRSAVARLGGDPSKVEPLVPVDLVIDHSVQVDYANVPDAFRLNLEKEFERNTERYRFLKWCMGAFKSFGVTPPGIGICHQVNLEYLARGVWVDKDICYPDSLVGTDSHTTMINGLGVVGWGVGGIEAEASMLGQPLYLLTPDVVGVKMTGRLCEGVTATDLVLTVTERLRKQKVVGKFVEFFGEGARSLPVPDRATIGNMAPEYGATMGFFPPDEKTCDYLLATGRDPELVELNREYYQAQGMFGMPESAYTEVVEIDLSQIRPSVAGPKRPQDRIELGQVKDRFKDLFVKAASEGGYQKPAGDLEKSFPVSPREAARKDAKELRHGDVLIAAITSCTNTSNPSVMLAAGLLAKKAAEKGLKVPAYVKTSLAPGSRVVSDYLDRTGLQKSLDALGFSVVGYGCTTCIGNSGPLDPGIDEGIAQHDLVGASVLSGNRNFEARVHSAIKANFLMSPPLVVAYAIAGTMLKNLETEPLGTGTNGQPVYLKDIWPTRDEIAALEAQATKRDRYQDLYGSISSQSGMWNTIPAPEGLVYSWDTGSTYIQEPPYFDGFGAEPRPVNDIESARALAVFGDSVTTDHISPAGSIKKTSPAGAYLIDKGVPTEEFNSYGARRGNHEVMIRGTFANVRIKNLLLRGAEGGETIHQPSQDRLAIYDAALRYEKEGVPLVIFAGQEYGTGSSRDWAAKGTALLGVRAVVAESFERIHRSNLIGMGVLPLQFMPGTDVTSLGLTGEETFSLRGLGALVPRGEISLEIGGRDGSRRSVPLRVRIDTATEKKYYLHGGILPYVLRTILGVAV